MGYRTALYLNDFLIPVWQIKTGSMKARAILYSLLHQQHNPKMTIFGS
jgi:hypothetical protein